MISFGRMHSVMSTCVSVCCVHISNEGRRFRDFDAHIVQHGIYFYILNCAKNFKSRFFFRNNEKKINETIENGFRSPDFSIIKTRNDKQKKNNNYGTFNVKCQYKKSRTSH